MSPAKASQLAGGSKDLIRNILRFPDKQPTIATLKAISQVLKVRWEWLADGGGSPTGEGTYQVPVMGYIGAGGEIMPEFEQVPPEGLDQIDLPFPVPPQIIGLGVKGISMMPAYKDGDAVLVWKDQKMATEHYLGEEAAVRTSDGRRFLKELQRGTDRGAYNLHSYNAPLIENVGIEWVGEIYLTVKAPVIRRMAQSQRAAETRRQNRLDLETDGMDELSLDKRA
ncbi:helix-turn-helix transcriptional regulator [Labrys sp. KB_33_2]|uniref:S24 family peptidase n=1 Tax=Labrys sp. KB_33_2 TaxID=3237479 RepID=UPI003F8E466D